MRYRKDQISKHYMFRYEYFMGSSAMGRIIVADELSAQPAGITDKQYVGLSEDEYIAEDSTTTDIVVPVYEDKGLRNLPRPGSLFPNGDAY